MPPARGVATDMTGMQVIQRQAAGAGTRARAMRDAVHFHTLRGVEALRDHVERLPVRPALPSVRVAAGVAGTAIALLSVGWLSGAGKEAGAGAAPAARHAARPAAVVGGAHRDVIVGGAGADAIRGRAGADVLMGGGGEDALFGEAGNDTIVGEGGDDRLHAGGGADVVIGGPGDDRIFSRAIDGQVDRIYCGPGQDTAVIVVASGRRGDRVFGCEHVEIITVHVRHARRG